MPTQNPNPQVAAGGNPSATANPTPFTINLPGQGGAFTDTNGQNIFTRQGNNLVQLDTNALTKSLVPADLQARLDAQGSTYNGDRASLDKLNADLTAAGVPHSNYNGILKLDTNGLQAAALKKAGIDPSKLQQYNMGDIQQAIGKLGGTNSMSSDHTLFTGQGGAAQSYTANGPGTGATPDPTAIAASSAAQQQQLAGVQGKNVTTQTDAQGNITSSQATPLGTAPAQTQSTVAANGQSPTQNAGAGAGAVAPPNTALQPGMTGPAVQKLQNYLVSKGLMSQADLAGGYGTYGPKTQAAVAQLQTQLGVDNSSGPGYFGPKTMSAIQSAGLGGSGITTPPTGPSNGTQTQQNGGTQPADTRDAVQKQFDMVNEASKLYGVQTIKQQWDDFNKQLSDITDSMNKEIADTKNNPWLSQSVQDRTVQKIQDKYQTKIDTFSHLATLAQTAYDKAVAQVNLTVSNANADIKATTDLAMKQADAAAALAKDNEVVNVGGRELLINKATGKTVQDLGAAPATAASNKANGIGGSTSGSTSTAPGTSLSNDMQAILEGRNTMYNIRQTMGRSNQAAAYMQSLRNAITKEDPHFDFVASDAGGKSVSTSYVQRATAAINSVIPNIQKVVDLSNQVSRIGVTGVDALLQKGGTIINNQTVSNFHEAQKLIADEIGVALGAGTVSDMKLQLGFDITDPSVSQEVFASNMGIVKDFLNNRIAGLKSLRYSSSTVGGGSDGSNPSPDQTQAILNQFF